MMLIAWLNFTRCAIQNLWVDELSRIITSQSSERGSTDLQQHSTNDAPADNFKIPVLKVQNYDYKTELQNNINFIISISAYLCFIELVGQKFHFNSILVPIV